MRLTQVNERRRNNDTGAKLLQDDEHGVCLGGHPIDHENREVNTNGTGDENDEEETDAERNVVVAGDLIAAPRAATLTFTTADAVLNTGMEVAVFPLRSLVRGVIGSTLGHDLHFIAAGCDAVSVRAVRVAVSEGGGDGRGGRVGRRGHDLVLRGPPHAKSECVSSEFWDWDLDHLHGHSMKMAVRHGRWGPGLSGRSRGSAGGSRGVGGRDKDLALIVEAVSSQRCERSGRQYHGKCAYVSVACLWHPV